jgi:hypothetical protein
MKEEDLIKKLKSVELPDIERQSHQRRLKMALLDTGYPCRRRENTILEMAKSTLKGVKDIMIKGLVSRQPVWKTATVGILVVALALGLSLTIPFNTNSVYAQAEEIVQNSSEVRGILDANGNEINDIEVTVIDISDIEGTVIAQSGNSSVLVKIDLESGKVTEVVNFTIDDQVAIEIAKADPRVQELLDAGAVIDGVSAIYSSGVTGNVETGEIEKFSGTQVIVKIVDSEKIYNAFIDLAEGKVTNIAEMSIEDVTKCVVIEVVPPPDAVS